MSVQTYNDPNVQVVGFYHQQIIIEDPSALQQVSVNPANQQIMYQQQPLPMMMQPGMVQQSGMMQQPMMMQQQPMMMQQQPMMMQQQPMMMQQQPMMVGQQPMMQQQPYYQGQPQLEVQEIHVKNNQQQQYQQGGYYQPQNVVHITNPNQSEYPTNANGSGFSTRVKCPFCKKVIRTLLETQSGTGTWIACLILFCLTGWCCCIPFCVEDCKDKIHKCPSCQQVVGIKEFQMC